MDFEIESIFRSTQVAEFILEVYLGSLSDIKILETLLTEQSLLDYFGKVYQGKQQITSFIFSNLYCSTFELTTILDNPTPIQIDGLEHSELPTYCNKPETSSPSLNRCVVTPDKNCNKKFKNDNCVAEITDRLKSSKVDVHTTPSSSRNNININSFSPTNTLHIILPTNIKYMTAKGTVRYARKRMLPESDPKRIKYHRLTGPRDRFCKLELGFQYDKHAISQCKLWLIKYSSDSRVAPRNLLSAFNKLSDNDWGAGF